MCVCMYMPAAYRMGLATLDCFTPLNAMCRLINWSYQNGSSYPRLFHTTEHHVQVDQLELSEWV